MLFFLFLFLPWGAKTATVAKLRGWFCSFFFLWGQNRNFVKVRERKLLLSQKVISQILNVSQTPVKAKKTFDPNFFVGNDITKLESPKIANTSPKNVHDYHNISRGMPLKMTLWSINKTSYNFDLFLLITCSFITLQFH